MTIHTITVREHSECERRWFFGGGVHTWLATAADTDGEFLMFEDYLDGGKATPLHQHPDADETFVMLDGEIRLRVIGRQRTRPMRTKQGTLISSTERYAAGR